MNSFKLSPARTGFLRHSNLSATVGLVVIGTAILWAYLVFFHAPPTPGELMNEFGYQEIVPPSKLYGPGTFNSVEHVGDQAVRLHPTCNMDTAVLEDLWVKSDTVDRELTAGLSRAFDISSEPLKIFKFEASVGQTKDVFLSLRNMTVLLMSEEDLLTLRDRYLKGACEKAIIHNVRHGACVRQSKAVLQADVVFAVRSEDHVSNTHHANFKGSVGSPSIGLTGTKGANDMVSGKELFYGVRLSPGCLMLKEAVPAPDRMARTTISGHPADEG